MIPIARVILKLLILVVCPGTGIISSGLPHFWLKKYTISMMHFS